MPKAPKYLHVDQTPDVQVLLRPVQADPVSSTWLNEKLYPTVLENTIGLHINIRAARPVDPTAWW